MFKKTDVYRFLGLVAAFFALYALTAQRGLGWGDSGEFQFRILGSAGGALSGCDSFATAHPLYVALGRLVCHSPFQVTLLSSFFGALSVGGLFLCTRRTWLAVLFGLSHMLWWLSCIAEVQTMNLAFTAFETFLLLRYLDTRRLHWMASACLLTGLHLSCHNFALLFLPVLAWTAGRAGLKAFALSSGAGALGASFWIWAVVTRGLGDVLVGRYGAKVAGVLPANGLETAFNFALAAMSFLVPAVLAWLGRKEGDGAPREQRLTLLALFAINALFFARYFVPDQATFLLPTLFFAYLLVANRDGGGSQAPLGERGALTLPVCLAAVQLLLPLAAWAVLARLPAPEGRTPHKYRNDATYFALPWKCHDTSADRCAAECEGEWTGYPRD